MNSFESCLGKLNQITLSTDPKEIVNILYIMESLLESQDKKLLRASFAPEALLHKIAVYYVGRYKRFVPQRYAEFCSEHDTLIYQLARFYITATRLKLLSFYLAAPLHALLALPPLSDTVPLLHFAHSFTFRLLADEQMSASFGTYIPLFLQKCASSLLEMVGLGIYFGITANANLLQLLLLKMIGNEQLSPLSFSIDDQFVLNRLPAPKKQELELKVIEQTSNTFENAEQAMSRQFEQLRKSIDIVYQVFVITYSACIHLSKNSPEVAVDLLIAVARAAGYLEMKLLRFCIVPCGIRGFVRYWKHADEALKSYLKQLEYKGYQTSKKDDEFKRMEKVLYSAYQKLPSLKFVYKYREYCVELAYRMMQLYIRALYLLNRQSPQLFGKLCAEFLIQINQALYVAYMAVDLANQEYFKGYLAKYLQPRSLLNDAFIETTNELELGKQEILCIKYFALYFTMPYMDFYNFQNVYVYEELWQPQTKQGEATAPQLLSYIDVTDWQNIANTTDLLFSLYNSYLDTPLHATSNQFLKYNLDSVENSQMLANFIARVTASFAFVRKCYMSQNLRGYCVLYNFDNFYLYVSLLSIFSIDSAAEKPFEVLAYLIASMISQFDNYNVTLAVQLFISSIIARYISIDYQNIRDYLYSACKTLLLPCLSGFRFNYNNILLKYGDQSYDGDFSDQNCYEFSGIAFYQPNISNFLRSNGLFLEDDVVNLEDIKLNAYQDIIAFDQQMITSGIIQTISLLSYLLDDMYEKFTEQLQGGFYRIKNVSGYTQILSNVMIALIQVVMPYFMNIDKTIMENMNFLLLELFQKLALKSPLSSCPLILGLRHQQSLLLKVQEVLLGQTVQMVVYEYDNTEYITAFLFSCLLSRHTDNVYSELLNSKILYTSHKLFPFRVITRHLFQDNTVYDRLDDELKYFFSVYSKQFKSLAFYQAISTYDKEMQIIFVVGKLISLLFEFPAYTKQQQKTLFMHVTYLVYGSQTGILSYIKPKQFCLNSATNDTYQDITMLLMMSLSQLCYNPLSSNIMISFVNYYMIYYASKFKIDAAYAVGKHLDDTLISYNEVCKDLFYRWLSLNAINNSDSVLFSYCFTQICHSIRSQKDYQIVEKKKDLLLYLCYNLDGLRGQIECNLLIQAIGIDSFEIQICICRYLKRYNYYLDMILINNIVVENTRSFYDAFIRKNQLLREVYDFDFQTYEGLLPLLVEQIKTRIIQPFDYVKYTFASEYLEPQNPYSNLLPLQIQVLNLHIPALYFTDETIQFGVKGGNKNSLWIKELNRWYFKDVRDVQSTVTQMAIKYTNLKQIEYNCLSLNEMAGLQLLLGKSVPRNAVSLDAAIDYLTFVYDDIDSCKCLRYASVPLRNHLAKYIEAYQFQNYSAITDLIPNVYLCHFIKMTNGFESYNQFLMDYIYKDHGLIAYSDNHYQVNISWAQETKYFSLEMIHTALQAILNLTTYENVGRSVVTLVNILNNYILTMIQNSSGDLYKFINYTPLTSYVTHQLVLQALSELLSKFSNQQKPNSQFCVLDDSFYQLSTALQGIIIQDDLTMELLNYNKTVVQYYYNKQLRRPKLNEEHLIHFYNCFLANQMAGYMSYMGYCSNIDRLVNKHFYAICGLPFVLISPFLLFALQNGADEQFKVLQENKLVEKLAHLLASMPFTQFTANVYNCFAKNGYFKERFESLLESLIDKCIDSPLFETLLSHLEQSDSTATLLKALQTRTINVRYYYAIAKHITLNSGDLTYLDLSEFIKRVHSFKHAEIDYLISKLDNAEISLFDFAQRYFEIEAEQVNYIKDQLKRPLDAPEIKKLCYLAAVFGPASFEDLFLAIDYFSVAEEIPAAYLASEYQNETGDQPIQESVDATFGFSDFQEAKYPVVNHVLLDQTVEYIAPLLSSLPQFTIQFVTGLLDSMRLVEDGNFAPVSTMLLAALSCFDFSYWYESLISPLLELLNNAEADYTIISYVLYFMLSKDATLVQRFGNNPALVRIAGGQLEKPSADEISLKIGFL